MKLTNIQASALKGRTFTHELGAMTVFTGDNDAGKTARTDAIRLILLGYIPELGKNNVDTFSLCSGTKMSVAGIIEGRGHLQREWTSKGKTIKKIETDCETLNPTPLVFLDAAEYFGKSDNARVQMLWDLLNVDFEQWTPAAITAKIKEALVEGGELPADVLKLPRLGETVQEWMTRTAEEFDEALKITRAEIAR